MTTPWNIFCVPNTWMHTLVSHQACNLWQLVYCRFRAVSVSTIPLIRLGNIEQPILLVFNLALLDTLESCEKFDTTRSGLIRPVPV